MFDEAIDIVRCRGCRSLLVKVDGSDHVQCLCGFTMDWADERVHRSPAFAPRSTTNTQVALKELRQKFFWNVYNDSHLEEQAALAAEERIRLPPGTAKQHETTSTSLLSTRPKHLPTAKLASRLSHDISTEQLLSDQLIDGKVADGEDDDGSDDDGSALQCPSTKGMYRIESHSALSSLEAKNMGRPQHPLSSPSKNEGATEVFPAKAQQLKALEATSLSASGATEQPRKPSSAQELQQQKRHELDKKHRTPLFYACAANRMACVALLLQYRADWRDLPDKQLDTPVHVCCFFGWHDCLAKLLDSGADPHTRNAKGFKPSHIAKTKDCLELLLTYGDDLLQGDKLDRTPLFVASARDRAPCVEFLCAWNHQTRSWMLEQEDQRGDRPIHAAACNGSVAALEILLKYGADPLTPNGKALTPKDLASANNHLTCVEILTRAEGELARATTWYAPANAAAAEFSGTDNNCAESGADVDREANGGAPDREWIECWDYDSGQPFYYHNLSGKCQWEVPPGFTPQLPQLSQLPSQSHRTDDRKEQQEQEDSQHHGGDSVEDDGSEYVWVKKKKQTVCVVTGKATEWTAVQDPLSKAIYYKNARTGQSQWEEPDAVQQLQSASGAHAAQEATRIWDELEQSRTALAAALAREKHRQLAAHRQTLENYKLHIRQRCEDMQKREEQARLQQLLPRSSFVRRKKQSMMMKVAPPGSGKLGSAVAFTVSADDERLEQICAKEPSLDIFLSTYLKLQGVRDVQVMTTEKRFCNCLYHYYVALVDPVAAASGLSKSQFRAFLRDAAIIPSAGTGGRAGPATFPLKLHVVDLIFAQAARAEATEFMNAFPGPPSLGSPHSKPPQTSQTPRLSHSRQGAAAASPSAMGDAGSRLTLAGFIAAMQIVRDRIVTHVESRQEEIDEDDEWFLTTYLLPLMLKLGAKLLTQIRECKELDMRVTASSALQAFLAQQRQLIQQLHRHYSSQESKLKMLSFCGLSQFTLDFGVLLCGNLPALHQLYEAVNWISGNAHTEIISFEKFQQLLTMLASFQLTPFGSAASGDSSKAAGSESHILESLITFFQQIERSPAKHRIKSELTVSASKISTIPSPLKVMGAGRSMRNIVGGPGTSGKLDKRDRVTLTAADGTQRDISVAEMERLAREQHAQQAQMQREAAAAEAARTAAATGESVDDENDGENAPERRSESLAEIRKSDPRFAANIALAQSSFAEIQRHGYARGYALAGFSEKDEAQKTKMTKRSGERQQGGEEAATKPPREDYTATLLLRAERRAGDRKARTGTSAHKRDAEPLTVSYEVTALLDVNDRFALLAAWELESDSHRGTRLSIKPNPEVVEQQQQRTKAAKPWFFQRADTTTWVLAGGVALIGAGLVVLYASQRPAPVTRRTRGNSADNWELAPSKKSKNKKKTN
ncbi:hypothetical protein PybrP1_004638 [[Pythium] brassicae (nom. inval.)]|nr:hypothetical protein PybrP1_004638 [[Pythium] brassicae (nom. inval.)]